MNYELNPAIKYLCVHILVSFPVLIAALFIYIPLLECQSRSGARFLLPIICILVMVVVLSFFSVLFPNRGASENTGFADHRQPDANLGIPRYSEKNPFE